MYKRLSSMYLTMAILGILTAIPILGGLLDVLNILTIIMFGFSIYILIKQKKGATKKTGAVLMFISTAMYLFVSFVVIGSVASVAAGSDAATAGGAVVGGALAGAFLTFPAWIIKIIAIVFCFGASSSLKEEDKK